MANFLTFTVLFFILPLSNARMRPLNMPENVFTVADLADTEVNPSLSILTPGKLLPENQPEKETGMNELAENLPENDPHANEIAVIDMLPPERADSINELAEKLPETESETETNMVKSVPLMMAKFRPNNYHIRLKWRLSSRPCHHHHHGHHQLFPYSSDMLIPTGEKGDFDPVIIHHNRFHQIPTRWISPHLHHNHHHDTNDDEESKSVFKQNARFGNDKFKKHFHHDDVEDEEEEKSKQFEVKIHKHEHKDNGLLQRIRKMLIF